MRQLTLCVFFSDRSSWYFEYAGWVYHYLKFDLGKAY